MWGGESDEAWVARVSEELVEEMMGLCRWMGEQDVEMLRGVAISYFGLMVGAEVDLGVVAGHVLGLAERAECVGDRRRRWAFEQWYAWTCAAMVGEEYQGPEMPEELLALP